MIPIRTATIAALASAVLATTLTGCQFGAAEEDTSPIVIGADLELSGASAPVGQAYQRALELKVEQLNASGALNGRRIELRIKDNRSDAAESLRNVGEFGNDSGISAVVMGGCNECAVGAVRTINERRVPTIALAASSEVVNPVVDRRYVFQLAPGAGASASVLVDELQRARNRTVAVLHSDDSYGREGLAALRRELTKANIELQRRIAIGSTVTDLAQPVQQLVSGGPDAVVLWTNAEQATIAANAAQQADFDGNLYFDAVAGGELFLGGSGRANARSTLVFTQTMAIDDVIATTPAKAARRQWFQDYTARYGSYHGFSSFAADAVQLIADAELRRSGPAGQVDRDGIRDVLETAQLDGLSGPIRITPDNHSALMPQALTTLVARGGRWRLAG
ncbi:ABC transporter substrate-binding protein [Micromonospora sp. SH-82]|uniref:ABC transporter substrate-binding protein n=1 Tax=Micromonospora sp. SH-82 TaxID=3132938 RepID=UPI003EBB6F0D